MTTTNPKILKETLVRVDGKVNVIDRIEWLIAIEVDGVTSNHAGMSELEHPTDNFIPFADLTDAQKLEWAFAPYGGLDALVERLSMINTLEPGQVVEVYDQGTTRFRKVVNMQA